MGQYTFQVKGLLPKSAREYRRRLCHAADLNRYDAKGIDFLMPSDRNQTLL
jgi:hypothetical protein